MKKTMGKALGKPTVSACIIVKDEERNIGRCLESLKNWVDEIVIVDTGSKDRTLEIVQQYPVKLIKYEWEDSFAKARNVSLDGATKKWILCIDADETMPEKEGQLLKNILGHPGNQYESYYVKLITMIDGEAVRESVVLRVFRNDKEYRFEGRIHEQIIQTIQKKKGENCAGNTPVALYHYGHDQGEEVEKRKQQRNIDLLLKCEEEEKHCYYYYVLGNEYVRADDVDEAIGCFLQSYHAVDYAKYPYMHYPYLIINLIKMYHLKGYYKSAWELIEEVKPTLEKFKDLYFLECLTYLETQHFSKAKKAYQEYERCTQTTAYSYPDSHFERSYNLPFIQQLLRENALAKGKDCISVVVRDTDAKEAMKTVQCTNEMATKTFVIHEEKDTEWRQLEEVGAEVLEAKTYDKERFIQRILEEVKSSYILLIKAGKMCSAEERRQILQVAAEGNGRLYELMDEGKGNAEPMLFGKLIRLDAASLAEHLTDFV
ncbi:MAG: glycosyltransferase family 2 protein [Cellulosilyticaceae bacterium]